MISEAVINERRMAAIVADEYRNRGYEVAQDVPLESVPDLRADLVVRKGDEVRVVAVKTRSSLASSSQASRLQKAVGAKPGWHFDLVLVGEPERVDTPAGKTRPLAGAGIARRVSDAESALAGDAPESAFLIAWSAGEAALRAAAAAAGIPPERMAGANDVFRQAVFHGIIGRDEYDYFSGMRKYRDAIGHGFEVNDFDRATAQSLIAAVKRIIASDDNDDSGGSGFADGNACR